MSRVFRCPRLLSAIVLATALGVSGCHITSGSIRRTIEITSEPAGAYVRVNGEAHGRTPAEVPFLWYWYHDIELQKEGYETLKVREYLNTPPHLLFPLDLFFELQPFVIRDARPRHYFLTPIRDY